MIELRYIYKNTCIIMYILKAQCTILCLVGPPQLGPIGSGPPGEGPQAVSWLALPPIRVGGADQAHSAHQSWRVIQFVLVVLVILVTWILYILVIINMERKVSHSPVNIVSRPKKVYVEKLLVSLCNYINII